MTPIARPAAPTSLGYPSRVSDPAPASSGAPGGPPPARRPASAPGVKRRRHQRWTRIATWATVVGVLVFVAFGVWIVGGWLSRSQADPLVVGTRNTLDHIASEVTNFVDKRGRLPKELFELRAPDLPSTVDALPWDLWKRPIEYRIVDDAGAKFRLRSIGPDGKAGTADDLLWPASEPWE
jgi:hypothetical protein